MNIILQNERSLDLKLKLIKNYYTKLSSSSNARMFERGMRNWSEIFMKISNFWFSNAQLNWGTLPIKFLLHCNFWPFSCVFNPCFKKTVRFFLSSESGTLQWNRARAQHSIRKKSTIKTENTRMQIEYMVISRLTLQSKLCGVLHYLPKMKMREKNKQQQCNKNDSRKKSVESKNNAFFQWWCQFLLASQTSSHVIFAFVVCNEESENRKFICYNNWCYC